MPGSSPTLLLAPTSRPSPLNSPRAASPQRARATHPPISRPGADAGLAEGGLAGWQPAAGGRQPTTGLSLVVHFGRQEARAVHRVPAAPGAAGAEMESGIWTCFCFPASQPILASPQTLAGPLTEAIKAVKAFARPLVRPQIAALGRLVVRGTPGNQGTGPLVDIHSLDIDVIEDTMKHCKLATYKGIHPQRKVTKLQTFSVPPPRDLRTLMGVFFRKARTSDSRHLAKKCVC